RRHSVRRGADAFDLLDALLELPERGLGLVRELRERAVEAGVLRAALEELALLAVNLDHRDARGFHHRVELGVEEAPLDELRRPALEGLLELAHHRRPGLV